jgi:hypothetical protein
MALIKNHLRQTFAIILSFFELNLMKIFFKRLVEILVFAVALI